jgi:hypothetical protein
VADSTQELLILDNSHEENSHAFTNPVMEVEWSNFVGQSSTDPGDDESTGGKVAPKVPQAFHSGGGSGASQLKSLDSDTNQNAKSDHFHIEPVAMVMERGGGGGNGGEIVVGGGGASSGEASVESTPDHTTQLLGKGKAAAAAQNAEMAEEKEEVVYVVDDGDGALSVQSSRVVSPSCPLAFPYKCFFFFFVYILY